MTEEFFGERLYLATSLGNDHADEPTGIYS